MHNEPGNHSSNLQKGPM